MDHRLIRALHLACIFSKHAIILSIYSFTYMMLLLSLEAPLHSLVFTCHILKPLITEITPPCFLQSSCSHPHYSNAHSSQLLFLLFCILLHSLKISEELCSPPKLQDLIFSGVMLFECFPSDYQNLFNSFSEHCLTSVSKWHGIQTILRTSKK